VSGEKARIFVFIKNLLHYETQCVSAVEGLSGILSTVCDILCQPGTLSLMMTDAAVVCCVLCPAASLLSAQWKTC
jgi:hypothetical protein